MRRPFILFLATGFLLAACTDPPSQNRYDAKDVGMNATVTYGTVRSLRQVQVTGSDTGTGAIIGGGTGGVAGSLLGAGKGSIIGALVGAIGGIFVGDAVEKNTGNRTGIEYIVALDNGSTQSVVQNIAKDDQPLGVGERVMLQTQGSYRRILPASITSVPAVPAAR